MADTQDGILAALAFATAALLAKRLRELGSIDDETLNHLRGLVEMADRHLPDDAQHEVVSILARARQWLGP